jgi:hypothetical protein
MGDWVTRTADGRVHVDLHQLPMRTRLTIAAAIVAVVVTTARIVDPTPRIPGWLGTFITASGWAVIGIVALLGVRWIVTRRGSAR